MTLYKATAARNRVQTKQEWIAEIEKMYGKLGFFSRKTRRKEFGVQPPSDIWPRVVRVFKLEPIEGELC